MGLLHHRSMGKLDIASELGKKEYKETVLQRFGKFREDKYRPEPMRQKTPQYNIVCRLVIPADKRTTALLQKEKEHKNKTKNRIENNTKEDNQ